MQVSYTMKRIKSGVRITLLCITMCLCSMGICRGVEYTYTYTELLPPGWSYAASPSINNIGMVAGSGTDSNGNGKGFIYNNGQYTELLPGGNFSNVALNSAINDNGVVVGYWGFIGENSKAFMVLQQNL